MRMKAFFALIWVSKAVFAAGNVFTAADFPDLTDASVVKLEGFQDYVPEGMKVDDKGIISNSWFPGNWAKSGFRQIVSQDNGCNTRLKYLVPDSDLQIVVNLGGDDCGFSIQHGASASVGNFFNSRLRLLELTPDKDHSLIDSIEQLTYVDNKTGEKVWTKTLRDDQGSNFEIRGITFSKDSSLICINAEIDNAGKHIFRNIVYDVSGKSLWQDSTFSRVNIDGNGQFLFCVSDNRHQEARSIELQKIRITDRSIVWKKSFVFSENDIEYLKFGGGMVCSFLQLKDGKIALGIFRKVFRSSGLSMEEWKSVTAPMLARHARSSVIYLLDFDGMPIGTIPRGAIGEPGIVAGFSWLTWSDNFEKFAVRSGSAWYLASKK